MVHGAAGGEELSGPDRQAEAVQRVQGVGEDFARGQSLPVGGDRGMLREGAVGRVEWGDGQGTTPLGSRRRRRILCISGRRKTGGSAGSSRSRRPPLPGRTPRPRPGARGSRASEGRRTSPACLGWRAAGGGFPTG